MLPDDPSFERIHASDTPRGQVAVYRTNGGATTAFGIVVRQECAVIPRVLAVTHVVARDDGKYAREPQIEDLARICRTLNDAGAGCILIGGLAVIARGGGRTTVF